MSNKQKETKKMLSQEEIYRIMQWLPIVVTSIFFIINLLRGNVAAMVVIGICLVAFIGILVVVKAGNVSLYIREYIMAVSLPVLVFVISLFSGASYSDDFPLFLAVIAMTGLYLEPQFTRTQLIIVDIFLVIMYMVHPEKAGELSQYILCAVCFTLAAALCYQVIKRGRAFIETNQEQAEEAEKLLDSIRSMGLKLQSDFDASSAKIEIGTQGLREGSVTIARGSGQVSESCNEAHGKIKVTEEQIVQLNEGVRQFENSLAVNRNNVEAMNTQIDSVSEIISESGAVFRTMEEQMQEIAGIAKKINDISFKLTILSLNASVEAAHAGDSGSGFEVLAAEMRELSEISTGFSNQVSDVVKDLLERVAETSEKFASGEVALSQSEKAMSELVGSFERLNEQFGLLYDNIECQNRNVNQIDYIFDELNHKVSDMHSSSLANQHAVEAIADAMTVFSGNVGKIVKNTQSI